MIWAKTDAGRAEMQARALVKDRAQRNLLLVIDGKTSAETLLAKLAGITAADFAALESLGLIAPVAPPAPPPPHRRAAARPRRGRCRRHRRQRARLRRPCAAPSARLISKELGMRGFALSMILDESMTVEDLKDVAQRDAASRSPSARAPAAAAAGEASS